MAKADYVITARRNLSKHIAKRINCESVAAAKKFGEHPPTKKDEAASPGCISDCLLPKMRAGGHLSRVTWEAGLVSREQPMNTRCSGLVSQVRVIDQSQNKEIKENMPDYAVHNIP